MAELGVMSVARPTLEPMNLDDVDALARDLMAAHGLFPTWRFAFDHAKRRAGACRHKDRTITVSRHLMALYPEALVREVLLHEIAHAVAGAEHRHDAVWKRTALAIGSNGKARLPSTAPQAPAPWIGRCPNGHEYTLHRLPRGGATCSICAPRFDPRFPIEWTRNVA